MKAPSAILNGCLAQLRSGPKAVTHVTLTARNSGVEQEGKPPPTAPQIYISVADGTATTRGGTPQPPQNFLERRFGFTVFISMRTGQIAPDRIETIYNRSVGQLDTLEGQIVAALHDQQAVRAACNALLDAGEAEFLFPPYYLGRPGTEVHDAGWSHEESNGADGEAVGWLVRRLPFSGFDRIEYSDSIH